MVSRDVLAAESNIFRVDAEPFLESLKRCVPVGVFDVDFEVCAIDMETLIINDVVTDVDARRWGVEGIGEHMKFDVFECTEMLVAQMLDALRARGSVLGVGEGMAEQGEERTEARHGLLV